MSRITDRIYYLYKTTNKINDEYYIGVHSTSKIDDGYLGSGKRLKYSIEKYGKENFEIEILEFFNDRESMFNAEKLIVNINLINEKLCLNLIEGGKGGWTNEQQVLNAVKSNEKKSYLRENDDEWRENEKKRNRENMILSYDSGTREKRQPMDWTGRKHKKESIRKMEKSKNVGKLNSQYGTKWVNKDGVIKKIKESELEYHICNGWIQGRRNLS